MNPQTELYWQAVSVSEISWREEFEDLSKHPSFQQKLNQPQVQGCEGDMQGITDIGSAIVPVKRKLIADNAKDTLDTATK